MSPETHLHFALRLEQLSPESAENRNWFARLCICLWVLHLSLIVFLAPLSPLAQLMQATGTPGFAIAYASAVVASVGIVDAIVNRFFASFRTICMMYQRHLGYMLMAALQLIGGVGVLHYTDAHPAVLMTFFFPVALCVAITVIDLNARSKEREKCLPPATL